MTKESKQYIVTNFAYGTGPYLRTTDLAIEFNNELERAGKDRLGIIVPLVYGEKQKRIMFEEFHEHEAEFPGEILLDEELGGILKKNFYGEKKSYEEALQYWVRNFNSSSKKAHDHLQGTISVTTITGQDFDIEAKNIVVELNRAPRLLYDVAPAYFTSFGYISSVLETVLGTSKKEINVDKELVKKGIEVAKKIEKVQKMHAIAYPGTFSENDYKPKYKKEFQAPPIAPLPKNSREKLSRGIFVTTTGIPGLEKLYKDAKRLGIKLYSNDTKAVKGSVFATPHIIPNKNTLLQFARSGWSSVWISMITNTPLLMPDFDPKDDPEICFNNKTVEALGLGLVYRGEPLEDILKKVPKLQKKQDLFTKKIEKKWGTLNGSEYCARIFVEDFLKSRKK